MYGVVSFPAELTSGPKFLGLEYLLSGKILTLNISNPPKLPFILDEK